MSKRTTFIAILIVIFLAYLGHYLYELLEKNIVIESNVYQEHDNWQLQVFNGIDKNNDGVLSYEEFLPFLDQTNYRHLIASEDANSEKKTEYEVQEEINIGLKPDEEKVTIECFFKPLVLTSLTKDVFHMDPNHSRVLEGLLQWKKPHHLWQEFAVSNFYIFLPPSDLYLGKSWWIIPSELDTYSGQLSSSRMLPPKVKPHLKLLHAMLGMFHKNVFLHSRFAPQGMTAVVRAMNEEYIDILFRLHAEFQLNEPPKYPFWFTPAQFRGQLIISRSGNVIKHFKMEVPTDRKLNVDMEWLNGPSETEDMEVDIGYIPQMSLEYIDSSFSKERQNIQTSQDAHHDKEVNEVLQWTQEIPYKEAYKLLERLMYPFKQVTYYNFTDAFSRAQTYNKLVHAVLLWGALDDQSC